MLSKREDYPIDLLLKLRGFGRDYWRRFLAASQGSNYTKGMGFLTLGPFPKSPLKVQYILIGKLGLFTVACPCH